ncbi:Sulfotransferase 1C3 [Porphyridium purpureum]|uniref:Sulfotransferase 1C3 n=1 Tax=Porphyridium purpureum TaxID=35688 RepID=A0A5J4ZAZ9_PORPP|nr:Sulfotransferase 1C3 [Porphyridium purpureum]|eukprot:POR9851..scf295_1
MKDERTPPSGDSMNDANSSDGTGDQATEPVRARLAAFPVRVKASSVFASGSGSASSADDTALSLPPTPTALVDGHLPARALEPRGTPLFQTHCQPSQTRQTQLQAPPGQPPRQLSRLRGHSAPDDYEGGKRSPALQRMLARLKFLSSVEGRKRAIEYVAMATDVIIASSPKTGTTLVQQIANGIRTECDMTLFDQLEEIGDQVPWVDLAHDLDRDFEGPQVAEPRLFKSHLWWHSVPKGGKYIYVVRDPLDTAVSFFHFLHGWMFEPGELTLHEFVTDFWLVRDSSQMGPGSPASYMHHLVSYYAVRQQGNVLWLFYEDLIEDKEAQVRRMYRFLGRDEPSADQMARVLDFSSFAFMKRHESKFDEKLVRAKSTQLPLSSAPAASDRIDGTPSSRQEQQGTRQQARTAPSGAVLSPSSPAPVKSTLPVQSKVREGRRGSGTRELEPSTIAMIERYWTKEVYPTTGCLTYEDLRRSIARERASGLVL